MPETAIRATGLYKKFRKGEYYDSLRDLLPALVHRSITRSRPELGAQEFWALRDVSFDVARGEAFGVIGHNGAGKSTLLKHLCGIMLPTTGSLEISGRLSALIEVGAGFHEDLTGRENIFLNGAILGMTRQEVRRKFDEIVRFSGLEDFIDTPVKRYSSGMYARLGFSIAAHVEPDIMVVDEVLSVGDLEFQGKSLEKMRAIMSGGTTVVFVSHDLRGVASLCQRTMLMEHGRVAAIGRTGDVVRAYLQGETQRGEVPAHLDVYISRVALRHQRGESLRFESGQRAFVDVEVEARRPGHRLAVAIECLDEQQYTVFATSTQRLGQAPLDLEAGEGFTATFQLDLNLGSGTYMLAVYVQHHDTNGTYHFRKPAATFFVASARDVSSGVARLDPIVTRYEKVVPGHGGVDAPGASRLPPG
jgi:homopolymeric O-antigen transport system ATP-binding protein